MSKGARAMNKAIWLLAIPVLLIGAFYAFWVPLPDTPARDTAGEMISVERDGRRLCYYVSGKGPPVILLASAGREVSDFNELVTTLNRAGYRTIAIEAPGIGNTPLPKGEPGLFDLADDVKIIARKELAAGEKAAIIGHAFGNRVARAFASKYDGDVNGVILIASGGAKPIPPKSARRAQGNIRSAPHREQPNKRHRLWLFCERQSYSRTLACRLAWQDRHYAGQSQREATLWRMARRRKRTDARYPRRQRQYCPAEGCRRTASARISGSCEAGDD